MNIFVILFGTYRRSTTRTLFTFLSIMVAFTIFGVLAALRHGVSGQLTYAVAQRLNTSNANLQGNSGMPISYYQRIAAVPGVTAATYVFTFNGYYQDPHNRVSGFFIPSNNVFKIYPEFKLTQNERQAWLMDRQGAIVGPALAKRMGWKVDDTIPVQLMPQKNGNTTWYFHLDGVYTTDLPTVYQTYFVAHYDYFNESVGIPIFQNTAGAFIERIADPRDAQRISNAIDAIFTHASPQTFTEPEQTETVSYLRQFADIYSMSLYVGLAVYFSLLLIVVNNMAQSVRERTDEFVILRVVGFRRLHVVLLIWIESLLLMMAGTVAGLMLGYGIVLLLYPHVANLLSTFGLTWQSIIWGVLLSVIFSLLASIMPAQRITRLRVGAALCYK